MGWTRMRAKMLRLTDWVVIVASEMTKAWIREVFRLCQQLVLAFSAVFFKFDSVGHLPASVRIVQADASGHVLLNKCTMDFEFIYLHP